MKHVRTCCFIDYGLNYLGKNEKQIIDFKYRFKETIKALIENFYVTNFITGMGLGFEQSSAEIVTELKRKYPQINLEAVLPYENFTSEWNEEERDKYYSLMQKIDKETLLQYRYTEDCIKKRNTYMVDKSKYIILLCNNTRESYNFTLYARAKKKAVFIVDPDTFNIKPEIRIIR